MECLNCGHLKDRHKGGFCNWLSCKCTEYRKGLPKQQLQVVLHLMNGLSMKEVATAMGLSVKTVQAHRTYACKRLNISGENNAKMTLTMLGLGLAHYSVENDVAVFVETKNS